MLTHAKLVKNEALERWGMSEPGFRAVRHDARTGRKRGYRYADTRLAGVTYYRLPSVSTRTAFDRRLAREPWEAFRQPLNPRDDRRQRTYRFYELEKVIRLARTFNKSGGRLPQHLAILL